MPKNETSHPIPLAVPKLSGRERDYILECLDTNWVSYAGPFVGRFEEALAETCGADSAVAVVSGTAALHVALILAGVMPGEEVLMPGITFVSPANAVCYVGAVPAFLDISGEDWQLHAEDVRRFIEDRCELKDGRLRNRATGRKIGAVLLVHLLGGLADSRAIGEVCAEFGLPLIEDAAECVGSRYDDRRLAAPLGCMPESKRFVAVSFNGNKIITTGGGGALLTNDWDLAARARHLTTTAKSDPVRFFHDELGYNYRMTNLAAAMGVAQLEVMEEHVAGKRRIASRYREAFDGHPGVERCHPEPAGCVSNYWLYTLMLSRDADPVIESMNRSGIMCRPIWHPMPELPYLKEICHAEELKFGAGFHRRAVCLPCSVGLEEEDQERVIGRLEEVLG